MKVENSVSVADSPVVFPIPFSPMRFATAQVLNFIPHIEEGGLIKSNLKQRAAGRRQLPTLARFQFSRNYSQQFATTCGVQTGVKCIIQQCWELLAHNVALVCTGLYALKNIVKETISGSCFVLLSLLLLLLSLLLLFIVIIYHHLN